MKMQRTTQPIYQGLHLTSVYILLGWSPPNPFHASAEIKKQDRQRVSVSHAASSANQDLRLSYQPSKKPSHMPQIDQNYGGDNPCPPVQFLDAERAPGACPLRTSKRQGTLINCTRVLFSGQGRESSTTRDWRGKGELGVAGVENSWPISASG